MAYIFHKKNASSAPPPQGGTLDADEAKLFVWLPTSRSSYCKHPDLGDVDPVLPAS